MVDLAEWLRSRVTFTETKIQFQGYGNQFVQGLIDPKKRRGHVTRHLAKFKSRLKTVQPLSGLNFARYTEHCWSCMPSSPLGVCKPLVCVCVCVCVCVITATRQFFAYTQ